MKYPIGIQNFEKIRRDGLVYVDKTSQIYNLVHAGSYYFFSRPRRFGKSLLVSTLEAYFGGKRELFSGLAIEKLEKDWTKYPILHLDLNTSTYSETDSLNAVLNDTLIKWEKLYGSETSETKLDLRFKGVVERSAEQSGQRVVVLVDEYDKPLLNTIDNEKLQNEYRTTLKAFYSVLKTQDQYIEFAFLTGVTRFSKVSIFSDLNNLKDISMNPQFVDICGITEAELHNDFDDEVAKLADATQSSKEDSYTMLKQQYDGYHFAPNTIGLYNPFSLLNALQDSNFGDYWFETGTPSYLVKLLKDTNYDLSQLQDEEVSIKRINSIDDMKTNPIAVIYQSGYLTIKGYDPRFKTYKLGFPNKEVEQGFMEYLFPFYVPAIETKSEFEISRFVKDVEAGNADQFMHRLQAMFADDSYQVAGDMELYYQNTVFLVFKIMGYFTEVERHTSNGRIDIIVKTANYIYIFELKLDKSAVEALQQINDKDYAAPFAMDKRKLYKIGVNFSSETRGIDEWVIE